MNSPVQYETNIQLRSWAGREGLKEFGVGWENVVVSRNMAREGQEMEDHSAMTPPLLLRRSDKKERMLLLAGIPLYGKTRRASIHAV